MIRIKTYTYNPEKSALLKKERGIDFEDVITLLAMGHAVGIQENPNKTIYPHQYIYEIDLDGYIYIVPFVLDGEKAFLKTIYPSRVATKKHKGRADEKNKKER